MTEPYFKNESITLYHGDSRDILSALAEAEQRFDLLLTDPPYGLDQKNKKPSGVNADRAKGAYADGVFDDTLEYMHDVVRPILDKSLVLCNLGIVTGGVESWMHYPRATAYGCMYCPSSPGFNSWGHNDYWPIWYYGRPKGNVGKYRILSHQVSERGFSKEHPCSKPLEFWKKLMLCGTDGEKGKSILDPFAGSGTTGEAAQQLGMKATLIELNERYCELIAKNCAQSYFEF